MSTPLHVRTSQHVQSSKQPGNGSSNRHSTNVPAELGLPARAPMH